MVIAPSVQTHSVRKIPYIDALRGYAVLLVITCHTGGMFAGMPYPVRKLTNIGWHGVQLFFLVSCVTLLMSWRSDERKGIASPTSFWTRRFFRIAPMYYLAALFYFFAEPPIGGFSWTQLVTSFAFVNAWSPRWIPTVHDRWMVVPGGWSIGVEFTFYFFFPLMVRYVRSLRAAAMFFFSSVAVACLANAAAEPSLFANYGDPATSNFLYFWFPNQLPIFALGTVLFFGMQETETWSLLHYRALLVKWSYPIIAACVLAVVGFAERPSLLANRFYLSPFWPPPFLLVVSLIFVFIVILLSFQPKSILINRPICALGEVSFSAYILHFFVIHRLVHSLPRIFDATATGYRAIAILVALWAVVVPATFALSWLTFRLIEKPMMSLGKRESDSVSKQMLRSR